MKDLIEYRVIDKSEWEDGPWIDEPDKAQWYDDETDLPCLMVRGPVGALCGYVGVRPGHPWHGKGYDDVKVPIPEGGDEWDAYPDVHGGLTFADKCKPLGGPGKGVCHIPREGDTDDVWWLGFDCAHCGDKALFHLPADVRAKMDATSADYPSLPKDVYRDYAYVRGQVANLAKQAAAVAS